MCSEISGKYLLVMLRHAETTWTSQNRFCGWYDAILTEKGKEDAKAAGKAIKDAGFTFKFAHTSMLTRAQVTLNIVLTEICQSDIPICKTWRLNERHYGALTGLSKSKTAAKYGEEKVQLWRRSFDITIPPMEPDHPYYDVIVNDSRYANGPKGKEFPNGESLKMTIARIMPYWNDVIIPQLKDDKKTLIVAHGTSLRGVVKQLDNVSDDGIAAVDLPYGIPFIYELDENLRPVMSVRFLGDAETVKKAIAAVAEQGKAE